MKKIQLSLIALLTSSNFVMAGGDILPVVFEEEIIEVEAVPIEPVEVVTPIVEETPLPEPIPPLPIPVADVSGFYAGLGIVATRYDTNCESTNVKSGIDTTAGIMARVGYDFNKYVGLEARGMLSNQEGDGGEVKHAGVFVKPMLPVGDATNLYGLVGVAKTTTQGTLRRTDVEGLAFGAGVEYDLSDDKKKDAKYDREFDGQGDQEKGLGLFVDYERLYYKSGSPDLDAVSAGVTYDF
jgi:opacity protein-like surface antigen